LRSSPTSSNRLPRGAIAGYRATWLVLSARKR
jgi:hypothetical protein